MKNKVEFSNASTLSERIRELREKGSKSNRLLSGYILEHSAQAADMTAQILARDTGVSEATVVRYAKSLGFAGYPEFQAALHDTLKNRLTSIERLEIAETRLGSSTLSATLNAEIRSLRATLETVSESDFDAACEKLLAAKHVYIIGTRSSTALADYMHFYMTLILDEVRLVQFASGADLYEQLLKVGSDDAVIGITFPRYSSRTVQAIRYAKSCGATTIAFTDSASSPVVPLSDIVLYARNDITSFVDSLVAPMALINALISELGRRRRAETRESLARLESLWHDHTVYDQG